MAIRHKHCGGKVIWEVYMKRYVCEKCNWIVHPKYIENVLKEEVREDV